MADMTPEREELREQVPPSPRRDPSKGKRLLLVAAPVAILVLLATLLSAELSPLVGATASNQAAASGPKAYVGLFKDNAVAVVDTGSNRVLSKISIPPGPEGMVATRDGQKVYVASSGASTVSVIDTTSDRVIASIEVGQGPQGLALTPDGEYLLVAVQETGQVGFVDTHTNQVVGQVAVPAPHFVRISPDGRIAYVGAQKPGEFGLAILDVAGRTLTGTIPLDKAPRAITFSPDGKTVYFTQAGVSAVQVLDTATKQVVAQIPVGASPHLPIFTPKGDLALVVVQGPNEIAEIDPATNKVLGTVQVGKLPHWISLAGDGHTAYVTNETSNDISVIDIGPRTVTATFPVGNAPRKMVILPTGGQASKTEGMARPSQAMSGQRANPSQSMSNLIAMVRQKPAAALTTTGQSSDSQGNLKVSIANFAFDPAVANIAPGQTVVWTNNDSVPHTVTSDDGKWDSGTLQPGDSFSKTFDQAGSYSYHCSIHPYMTGTVAVRI